MISTQQLDASGGDRTDRHNPDLFIGDIVPGYQSFIPYLLDLRNQESKITNNLAIGLPAFRAQPENVGEQGSAPKP
ncbi:hypothetical protein [Tychonema sp. LEGE 07203]|uniref:hypothetical protein n=1 Tax=Tychonema sp. LEGE 07203 TaxID=1828671 RepID=UPI00187FC0AB|nr:hypothetical protein [Tychonema sp. LEGE 07203]MBE9094456.1 hypothetical protein [Tychonema sp. LEGE 07203]